ncbi:Uncharacterized protein DAT39_005006, partial [Clarias magur]
ARNWKESDPRRRGDQAEETEGTARVLNLPALITIMYSRMGFKVYLKNHHDMDNCQII